ncbi:hypothetical protein PVA45_07590 (plasmid) [Entomospira entomophila]|uniref:Uncharacterized protein n=1 Tax=Entomospira entomophila TaxID=2719988 RepID=A0A968GA12_9SPIO|nr:hypothetical protein [Entomospira entomophilus]NIZ41277.1 hypothetical protein [Entomospira entomophilus]WDI36195.1 hypothetical protein PVA45_07590 [Entomospira entomophilus]
MIVVIVIAYGCTDILAIGYATEKHSSDRHEQTRKSLSQYITYPQDFIR